MSVYEYMFCNTREGTQDLQHTRLLLYRRATSQPFIMIKLHNQYVTYRILPLKFILCYSYGEGGREEII
jgi:hypothetical protein